MAASGSTALRGGLWAGHVAARPCAPRPSPMALGVVGLIPGAPPPAHAVGTWPAAGALGHSGARGALLRCFNPLRTWMHRPALGFASSGDHCGSWSHFFSWKSLTCHFEPQFFFGAAAPLPGAAWPPRRGPPQRARFSFFTESYDFAAPFQIQSPMRLLRRNGPLPRMHRVERGVSSRPSCACDMAPSAAHLHALLSLLALLLMSCHQGAQQRACERVGVALVECSCVCRCEGAMRVCPNWDQRSPCSGCRHSKYGVRGHAWTLV